MNHRSVLILLSLPILGIGAFALWIWTGLTAQPIGLTPVPAGRNTYDRHQRLLQAHHQVWLGVSRSSNPARLTPSQIQTILTADIAHGNEGKRGGQVLRAIQVRFEADRLISTTQLDLSQIAIDEMSGRERTGLLRLLKRLPGLGDRSIGVTIEGRPIIATSSVIGLADVRIQVGRFRWTIDEASRYLQVPPSYIEEMIQQELVLVPMEHFTELSINNDALVIQGSKTAW